MMRTSVDVVIPLHRADRAIEAAVASAQTELQGIPTQVSVVLHNLTLEEPLRTRLASRATVLHCHDGIYSPSGPRNVGLDAAMAPFVFFLDSDDELAPQCLRRLHDVAELTGADVVLPSIRSGSTYVGTPLVARRHPELLDVVRHHLFLRSHVPALLRRSMLVSTGIRYPAGIRTGEDFALMSELFARVPTGMAFDAVYDVLGTGADRASTAALPAEEQLAGVRHVLTSRWVDELPHLQRQALARRILAVNLAGGWRMKNRLRHELDDRQREEHLRVRSMAEQLSPDASAYLSVRDRTTLAFDPEPTWIRQLLMAKPFGLVPSSWAGALSRRSPLVHEARSWVVRHRRRAAHCSKAGDAVTALVSDRSASSP